MNYVETIQVVLLYLAAFNIWILCGGLVLYFIDPEHVYENTSFELLIMYFMFPVIIVLSLLSTHDNKSDTTES